jgi:hypothetical protein
MTDFVEMTLEEYLQSRKSKKGKQSKYRAQAVLEDGYRFDSQAEHQRYRELMLLWGQRIIRNLTVHPRYVVWQSGKEKIVYEADFSYLDTDGQQVVEDVKGVLTAVYRLKKKMFLAAFPQIKFVELH